MASELAVAPKENRLATPAPEFSNDQIRLLGETVAKGCDQNELAFFLHVAKLKRLDPFTGQIHVVKRWDTSLGKEKMTVQVGIDGFRVIASRTDDLAGIDDPEYDTETDEHPNVAKVTVYRYGRGDERIPYRATARWSEYAQTKKDGNLGPMWKKLPYLMLGKCAEALALRKAFPDELSGMYTNEEMDQADSEGPVPQGGGKKPPVQQPSRASEKKQQPAAQQAAASPGEVSGIIESVKTDSSNNLWMVLKNGGLIKVMEANIDGDMKPGYFIKIRGESKKNAEGKEFHVAVGLMELSPVQDGTPAQEKADKAAPLAPDAQAVADEMFGKQEPQGNAAVQQMVDNGTLKPASALPEGGAKKPGTIGIKRAQRVWALINQNKANNHGFNETELKKIMTALPVPIEHLRDLEMGMYEQVERWATGENDWQDFWKED